jgi:hypothetical protein
MATSDEMAAEAWLDLAEYARQSSDKVSGIPTKQTMLALSKLCEALAVRHLYLIGNRPANDDPDDPDAVSC